MRHFLSLYDVSHQEFMQILTLAEQVKELLAEGKRPAWLPRSVLALLFEKQSLRTRVSFEAGIAQLGGSAMFLGADVGWGKREPTSDFIRVLAEYADFVVCRAKSHELVTELASFDVVPVINGLTDLCHPCQALADLLTIRECCRELEGKVLTFIGDGNNVALSVAIAAVRHGMQFRLAGPEAYLFDEQTIAQIKEDCPWAVVEQTTDAVAALGQADFVYTDVWISMGQEAEAAERRAIFAPFQLNEELLKQARPHCKIMHCLPARRGEEVTAEVLDGANSIIVQQAGNRMHAQKALLLWLALQQGRLTPDRLAEDGITI